MDKMPVNGQNASKLDKMPVMLDFQRARRLMNATQT